MNCKDCIHVKVCGEYVAGLAAARGVIIDNQAELEEILECDDCEHFKDSSRLKELPCKVGDTVYFILRSFDGKMRINPEKVCYFTIDANELRIHTTAGYFTERDMNDGVFFTRERAEQALKGRES